MPAACSETVTVSVSFMLPFSSASKIKISVMIFVMLAGCLAEWESFSKIIVPVEASINRALGAATEMPAACSAACASKKPMQSFRQKLPAFP